MDSNTYIYVLKTLQNLKSKKKKNMGDFSQPSVSAF